MRGDGQSARRNFQLYLSGEACFRRITPCGPIRKMVDEILKEMSPAVREVVFGCGAPIDCAGAAVAVVAVADLLFGAQ